MAPHCRRCKGRAALSKPLFQCVQCSKYYHAACHRPHPQALTCNWVCKRCLAGQDGQVKKRRHLYHDKALLPSRATPPSSAFPTLHNHHHSRMSPSTTATIFPATVPPAAQETDSTGPIIRCSVTGCLTRIDSKRQTVCEEHLRIFSTLNHGTEDAQVNNRRILTGGLPETSSSVSQDLTISNPRKLSLETDKDQPIVRRLPARKSPLFMVRQSTSQDNAHPSARGVSALSPPSSRPLAPRPPAHSPPASPGSVRDGDSARKRQKLSPSSTRFTAAKVDGVVPPWLSTADPALSKTLSQPKSPQVDRRASTSSQLGKSKDGASRPGPKSNPNPSLRKVAPKWSKLSFIDDPGEPVPVSLGDQSSSTANEPRGDSQQQDVQEPDLSPNGETEGYVGRKPSSVASSTTLIETVDPLGNSARRLSELSSDEGHNKSRADIQVLHQSCEKDGSIPNPLPRRHPLHIKPSQAKTQSGHEPKVPATDSSRFDSLIYSQPGASSPPPQLNLDPTTPVNLSKSYSTINAPLKEDKDEALYLDIDPRIHWPQTHSQEWLTRKQAEIQARGNRKANFGRAASTLRKRHQQQQQQQQQQQAIVSFEDSLPEKIAENPAWVRALTRLQGLPTSLSPAEDDDVSVHGSIGGRSGAGCENRSGAESTNVDSCGQQPPPQPQVQDHQRGRGRKANGRIGGHSGGNSLSGSAGGIASKRIGNSGVVVVTGLNGLMKGFDRDVQ